MITYTKETLLTLFEGYCRERLGLTGKYTVKYTNNGKSTKTYAHFEPSTGNIVVYTGNRSVGDICRSVAHELVHQKQNELGLLDETSGKTGSSIENKANAGAGILIREFGALYPQIYR